MRREIRSQILLCLPGFALAAGAAVVTLEGPNAYRLVSAALAGIGVLLVWGVAIAVRALYPARPVGHMLFLLAGAYALQVLSASPVPVLFTLGRASRPAIEVLLIWVMLAFPSGHLQSRAERALLAAAAFASAALWLPSLMTSPEFSMNGPFVMCRPRCPRNMLFVDDLPAVSHALGIAFRVVSGMTLIGTAVLLSLRLQRASRLTRITLAPVLLASIVRTLSIAAFVATDRFAIVLILTFWGVPIAIAIGLLRGRLYVNRALQKLVVSMRTQSDMQSLRDAIADAVDDPGVSIAYWIKDIERWVGADGSTLSLPYPSPERGRTVTIVSDADGKPVAALIHDVALLEDPTLVDAVASRMLAVLESHRMDAELKASQAHAVTAVEEERLRIERDLHDGAQQRLIALRTKLSIISRLRDHDPYQAAAMLDTLGSDIDDAMSELRAFARGIVPSLLIEQGLSIALADVVARTPTPVTMEIDDVGRFDPSVEKAVYFCCVEALQNVAKHAANGGSARLALHRDRDALQFSVTNIASGRSQAEPRGMGQGLENMRWRVKAVGGNLEVDESLADGFCVRGSVPVR